MMQRGLPRGVTSGKRVAGVCLVFAGLLTSGSILAQAVLEEIIVTAQKREQSIQDIGIAITAFSGEQIKQLGFHASTDIIAMTPGVSVGGDIGGQRSLFMIRGVVQNDFADFVEAPISVYIDEGYLASGQAQTFGMFDIDRVEVLKGPQGTLFGRNATGGLVHFITRKPTQELDGYIDVSGGEYALFRVEGGIGGPLTETLSARVSGLYRRHDEILNNKFPFGDEPAGTRYPFGLTGAGTRAGEDTWIDDTTAFRAQIMFEPSDSVNILVSGYGFEVDKSEGPYQSTAVTAVVDAEGRIVETVFTPRTGPESRCEVIAVEGGCVDPSESTSTGAPRLITEGVDGELFDCTSAFGCPPGVAAVAAGTAAFFGVPDPMGTFEILSNLLGVLPDPRSVPTGIEDGLRPVAGGDLFGYIDPDGSDFDTSKDFALKHINEHSTYGITAKIEWDPTSALRLTSVSDWKEHKRYVVLDIDSAPVPQSMFQTDSTIEQVSQELRLNGEWDRVRGVAGFYYLNIDSEMVNGIALPINSPLFGLINVPGDPSGALIPFGVRAGFLGAEANNFVDLETNSYSLFGQVDYDLTDRWTLILGLRGVIEEKEYRREALVLDNSDPGDDEIVNTDRTDIVPGTGFDFMGTLRAPFIDDDSKTLWAGKAQLEFKPNQDWLLYFGVNRGVKAYGYNAKLADGTPDLPDDQIPYDEEVLLAYEAGFKATLFDGSTRLNGSFYFYDYTDYQGFLFFQSSGVVSNVDGEYKGFEIEAFSSPLEGLDLMAGFSYIDAELQDLAVAPGVLRDVEPSFTPDFHAVGIVRYTWPEQYFGGNLALQFHVSHQSEYFHNIRNFQVHEIESRTVGNIRASWVSSDQRWEGTLFVNNLWDERARLISFDLAGLCGCQEEAYIDPQWIGASLRYDFF
jgi:iron complex outermembrane receptor protein